MNIRFVQVCTMFALMMMQLSGMKMMLTKPEARNKLLIAGSFAFWSVAALAGIVIQLQQLLTS